MKLQEIFRFVFSKWNVPSTIAALVAKNDNTYNIKGNFQIFFFHSEMYLQQTIDAIETLFADIWKSYLGQEQ